MNRLKMPLGILSLLAAAALFLFDFSELHFLAGGTDVNVYPAIVLTVIGVVLVAGARGRERSGA